MVLSVGRQSSTAPFLQTLQSLESLLLYLELFEEQSLESLLLYPYVFLGDLQTLSSG